MHTTKGQVTLATPVKLDPASASETLIWLLHHISTALDPPQRNYSLRLLSPLLPFLAPLASFLNLLRAPAHYFLSSHQFSKPVICVTPGLVA